MLAAQLEYDSDPELRDLLARAAASPTVRRVRQRRRRGITLAQIEQAGLYTRPTTPRYREAMLEMVERGRDDAGRVGDAED